MRTIKFWYNEWQHSYIMSEYWRKRANNFPKESRQETKAILIAWEYNERCADAFKQLMRCLNV